MQVESTGEKKIFKDTIIEKEQEYSAFDNKFKASIAETESVQNLPEKETIGNVTENENKTLTDLPTLARGGYSNLESVKALEQAQSECPSRKLKHIKVPRHVPKSNASSAMGQLNLFRPKTNMHRDMSA